MLKNISTMLAFIIIIFGSYKSLANSADEKYLEQEIQQNIEKSNNNLENKTLKNIWSVVELEPNPEILKWHKHYQKKESVFMEPTGPIAEGWPYIGADLEADINKLDGGLLENVLISGVGGLSFYGGGYEELDPQDWQLVYSGSKRQKKSKFLRGSFYSLSDKHIIYHDEITKKIGNAYCWEDKGLPLHESQIYRRNEPKFNSDNDDDLEFEKWVAFIARGSLSIPIATICTVYFKTENDNYIVRHYNENGKPLSKWDDLNKSYKIVPKDKLYLQTTDLKDFKY